MSVADLTSNEREVLEWIAEGLTNRAIAERLCVTERAVEKRCESMFVKLDLFPPNPRWNRRVVAVLKFMEAERV